MSNRSRLGLIAATVVIAVAAFLVLKPSDEDEKADDRPATAVQTSTAPARPAEPPVARIEIRDRAPVGGVKEIAVGKGERIRFVVRSADTSDEVHLHGYDIAKDLAPGRPVRFDVPATIDGAFEVELEHAGVQIAKLTVQP